MANNCVTGFMISRNLTLFIVHYFRLSFWTNRYTFKCFSHIFVRNRFVPFASCRNCCFVGNVCKIRTRRPRGLFGKSLKIYVFFYWFAFKVNFQNFETIFSFWQSYIYMTVKTTRAKKSFIKHIYTVSCRHHNYARIIIKTIHFYKDLVQGLLVFTACPTTRITFVCYCIDLIDKDNRRCIFLGFRKQITNPACANAHKHFCKF